MHEKSDAQLLRDYAESGNEAAFRELICRHTDFIYSAALRQVESPDLACDIAQSVFTDLARKAKPLSEKLAPNSSLAGWLHRGTRYAALNHLRDSRRRLANERQAMEQLLTDSESSADWEQIRPALDEALDSLSDEDREALLLRYFKNQDFRAVGLALGVSDDAAQKRVSRAVERLREFFSKRGVTVGASGLVILISANAVQAAPATLAAQILAGTLTSSTLATTAIAATKTIAMTTLQKTLISATLVAAIGTGMFEARQASQLREQNRTLQQRQVPLTAELQQLRSERDKAFNQLTAFLAANSKSAGDSNKAELLRLRGEVTHLQSGAAQLTDPTSRMALEWADRKNKLQELFRERPEWQIPDLGFLKEQDWLTLARDLKLDSENDIKFALHAVRESAKIASANVIQVALQRFLEANRGEFPTNPVQLNPYFKEPIGDAILDRYRVRNEDEKQGWLGDVVLVEKTAADKWAERQIVIGPRKIGIAPTPEPVRLSFPKELVPVMQAYQDAHRNEVPDDMSKLEPYTTSPEQRMVLKQLISDWNAARQ